MKIFEFRYGNYYRGARYFKVLAHSEEEAWEILRSEKDEYLRDEESNLIGVYVIELDKPKLISCF